MSSKDDLVRTTIDLIRERGVAGTGIADILEGSGRSRRTVYINFPGGKADLVDAATRTAGGFVTALMEGAIARSTGRADLFERLGGVWRQVLVSSRFRSGCPIVAATLGRADSPQAADSAGAAFNDWIALIAARLAEDTGDPELARQQATTIIAAIEGAVVLSMATQSQAPIDDVEKTLVRLFGEA